MAIKRPAEDKHFSDAVRLRDGRCLVCGKTERLECAHIHGRRKKSVRWSMDNAVTLCHYHHRHFTEQPVEFIHWLNMTLGEGHMAILNQKANAVLKTTAAVRKEVSDHYRGEVKAKLADPDYVIESWN